MTTAEIVAALGDVKKIYAAASGLVTLLLGRFVVPAKDDLPGGLIPVFALAAAAGVAVMPSAADRPMVLTWLFVGLVIAVCVYLAIYWGMGMEITIDTPRSWWQVWKSKTGTIRIMRGLVYTAAARTAIKQNQASELEFFEGANRDPDNVWTRSSRVFVIILLVLAAYAMIVLMFALLYVAVQLFH